MTLALSYSTASQLTKVIFVSPTVLYKICEGRMAQDLEDKFGRKGLLEKYSDFLTKFKDYYEIENVTGVVKREDLYGKDGIEVEIPQNLNIDKFSCNVSSLFYQVQRVEENSETDLIVQDSITGQRYINGVKQTKGEYVPSLKVGKHNVCS